MNAFFSPSEARGPYHLLVFVLTVGAPLSGWLITRRIEASLSSISRLTGYQLAIAVLVLTTAASFALVPPQTFFDIQLRNRGVTWLPSRELISVMAVTLVLMTALPVLLARKVGSFRVDVEEQIKKLQRLLPRSRREHLWFGIAAVCAGICEEFLYRGFILHYLHVFPWKLNLGTSLIISCVIFGVVHLYQGFSGILQTILLALGLSILFLSTRSLMLPIVLHVLIDLRIFLVLPEPASPPTV
jgi:membrane protease YdiL (CAAX protease family)